MAVEIAVYSFALAFAGAACFYGIISFLKPERIDLMWGRICGKIKTINWVCQTLQTIEDALASLPPSVRRQFYPFWRENNYGFLRLAGLVTFVGAGVIFFGLVASIIIPAAYKLFH